MKWATAALIAALLVPLVYWAATAYGAESVIWNATYSTYTYVERPGGFAVTVAGITVAALLAVCAVGAAILAAISFAQQRPGQIRRG